MILVINVKHHSKNDALSLTPLYVSSEPELQALLFFHVLLFAFCVCLLIIDYPCSDHKPQILFTHIWNTSHLFSLVFYEALMCYAKSQIEAPVL